MTVINVVMKGYILNPQESTYRPHTERKLCSADVITRQLTQNKTEQIHGPLSAFGSGLKKYTTVEV